MSPDETLQHRFAVRYYRWALDDFSSEIAGGFPRTRQIAGPHAWRLLNFMNLLQPAEQICLATGLVKRYNPRAVALSKELPSQAELASVEGFLDWARGERMPQDLEITRQKATGNWRQASRGEIQNAVNTELGSVLGSRQKGGSAEATYVRELAGMELYTMIDTGASAFALDYSHLIISNGRRFWPDYISILSWFGVAATTSWSGIRDADVGGVVHTLRQFCELFISVLPSLLSNPTEYE